MLMRRFIGISLACLVTSACAIEKTPEESASQSPGVPAPSPSNEEKPANNSPVSAGGVFTSRGSVVYGFERVGDRAGFESAADACGGVSDLWGSRLATTGIALFGK